MKSPSSALIALSFFLLAFTTKPLLSWPIALRDSDGDKVLVGQSYFIRSPMRGAGEAAVSARLGLQNRCPVDVAWRQGILITGNSVRFSLVTNISSVVNTDTNLNIKFTERPLFGCNQSTVWRVGDYQPWAGKWFITTDGIEGEFGPETYRNWFHIEKVAGTCDYPLYKLVHCPSRNGEALCSDVGVSYDDGGRLVLDNTSFTFVILKDRRANHSQE